MRLISLICFVCIVAVTSVTAQVAEEKTSDDYPSFTIGIGYGTSFANGICIPCHENDWINGHSLLVDPGIRFNKKIQVELISFMWFNTFKENNPPYLRMHIMARINYFPFKYKHLLFQLSAGGGGYFYTPKTAITTSDGHTTLGSVIGSGFASSTGVGYELKLSRSLYIIPNFNMYLSFPHDLMANNLYTIDNNRASIIVDLGLTLRLNAKLPRAK